MSVSPSFSPNRQVTCVFTPEGAAASRALECKKAWIVGTLLMGLHNSIEEFQDEWIQGSIARTYKKKRFTKQATCASAGKGNCPLHKHDPGVCCWVPAFLCRGKVTRK